MMFIQFEIESICMLLLSVGGLRDMGGTGVGAS